MKKKCKKNYYKVTFFAIRNQNYNYKKSLMFRFCLYITVIDPNINKNN